MKTAISAQGIRQWVFPTRALALLLGIGFFDLAVTAVLHSQGLVVELNPLMRPLIEHSEWLFAGVKALTLVAAWGVLAWYAQQNLGFVRKVCVMGAALYVVIWSVWFFSSA
jgi:hypothetical protein